MVARKKSLHRFAAALVCAPLLLGATPTAQLAGAVSAQRQLVAEQPDNAGALNDLGNLLAELGEVVEAEEAYRRAVELAPDLPEPAFNLSLLLAADGRPREARKLLQAMLRDHPRHAWGHYQLGTLLQAAGNRDRALRSYREAFRLDPSLSDPRVNPHVLDNSLATAAMLEAFSMSASAATSQRIYVEPERVKGLLLPPLAPMADGEAPAEEAAEPMATEEVTAGPGG